MHGETVKFEMLGVVFKN